LCHFVQGLRLAALFGAQELLDAISGSYSISLATERVRPLVALANGDIQPVSPAGNYTLTVKYDGESLAINGTDILALTASIPAPVPMQPPTFANALDTVDPAQTSLYLTQSSLVAGELAYVNIQPRDSAGELLYSLLDLTKFTIVFQHEADHHQQDRAVLVLTAGMINTSTGLIK
jgi:hypothetical protein